MNYKSTLSALFRLARITLSVRRALVEYALSSFFARGGAEAQRLFGFAADLTDWADYHRSFIVGGSRVSLIRDELSELTK